MTTTEQAKPMNDTGDGNVNGANPGTAFRRARRSHLQWIALGDLHPSPNAQRELSKAWANELAADFDLEGMGYPVVSRRNGHQWVIDGQHRVEALRILEFGETDLIQCEVYDGLTEEEEAELFLERNEQKTVHTLARFRVAVKAGRAAEVGVAGVLRDQGLHFGKRGPAGAISAVGSLVRGYKRIGPIDLGRGLRVIRDAYGDRGFDAPVIDALVLFMERYGTVVQDEALKERLAALNGGLQGLLNQAEVLRDRTGDAKAICIAQTIVLIYNRSQKTAKLAAWK